MARGNVPATCVAFKRLLRRNDDRSLPLVEKICHSMCFWGRKPPLNRQGPDRRLFFCAAFSFTSYYEESDRGQTITAKKTTNRRFQTDSLVRKLIHIYNKLVT